MCIRDRDSPSSHCILSFGGIANKCTIWLNGKLLGTHEGMFGGPDFSIGNYLKNKNTLIVKLEAIPQMFLGNWPPNANESWKYTVVFNCCLLYTSAETNSALPDDGKNAVTI